ncbi:MAG TPA: hypothetical protein VMZ69_07935 [Saprospiraceae bacterium]|nr:hypothetical protein [Saprospiraceae bacterium]
MAQIKYKETQHLRQWDLMIVLGGLIVLGVTAMIQLMMNGQPSRNLVLVMALGILVLSGLFYYLNTIKLIARYNEKNIKLSMLPIGTEKRKIKWEDVERTEIVQLPAPSKLDSWNNLFSSLTGVITRSGDTCLHLKLKNNEEINIGCADRKQLEAFVQHLKEYHPGLEK